MPVSWSSVLRRSISPRGFIWTRKRLKALWPERMWIWPGSISRPCGGSAKDDPQAGPIARLSQRERFHWIISPRSTIIQPSPVHTGVCDATDGLLDRLAKQFLEV